MTRIQPIPGVNCEPALSPPEPTAEGECEEWCEECQAIVYVSWEKWRKNGPAYLECEAGHQGEVVPEWD